MPARITRRRLPRGGACALLGVAALVWLSGCSDPSSSSSRESDSERTVATRPPPSTSAPTPTPRPAPGPFHSSFERGGFGEWSLWRRDDAGTMYVATAAAEGIPAREGRYVARFEVDAGDASREAVHSKLYKSWAVGSAVPREDDAHRRFEPLPEGGPDGTYSAWFRFPRSYVPDADWVNIFQWKEGYLLDAGDPASWRQDPQWWLNVAPAGAWDRSLWPRGAAAGDPVLVANNWEGVDDEAAALRALPLGRWFEVRALLYSGDRIDWYVDGEPWTVSSAARYPVGLSKDAPVEWVFGVGHYGGRGHLWVDAVAYEPF